MLWCCGMSLIKGLCINYNPCDYTLEIYSDSDWRNTNKHVGQFLLVIFFLFGCLLYSTSRSQRALAMSSAEAEIYSATSATSDAVLMFRCIKFAVGEGTTIEVRLAMDNSAGRSFFGRIGVGRIRHISLRVLWVQAKVKEGFMQVRTTFLTWEQRD